MQMKRAKMDLVPVCPRLGVCAMKKPGTPGFLQQPIYTRP